MRVKEQMSNRMTIEKTGKASSVRISVRPVWFEKEFQDKVTEVEEALVALSELYEMSKRLLEP